MTSENIKQSLFAFDEVSFNYPNRPPILDNVSFSINFGESVALLSNEGSGRSTMLKLMVGIAEATKGNVFINELPLAQLPENVLNDFRAQIGFLFSKGALINNLSVYDNIALPYQYHTGLNNEEAAPAILEIINKLKLNEFQKMRPAFVSEYVRCMTGVARALVMMPSVLLVDNIFDGLSRKHVVQLVSLLNSIKEQSCGTFVYAANDPELLYHLTERVLFFDKARLHFDGTFEEFFGSQDPIIRDYLKDTFVRKDILEKQAV